MIFYLTNVTLDVVMGATWWVVSKTASGLYYLAYGRKLLEKTPKEQLDTQQVMLTQLIEQSKLQKEEILRLHEDIRVMTDYFKQLEKT